jgi:Gpi18-like mannosyltransferase
MLRSPAIRSVILIWLAWVIILLSYQSVVSARFAPRKPDTVLPWTASVTNEHSQATRPYLTDPFMNAQVSWDSEFYLSIATQGYNDPQIRSIAPQPPFNRPLSLNYAFFPAYPYLMRFIALPLSRLGWSPIATATLAGVLISTLATLAAMLALHDLSRQELGEEGGIRAAFYLITFPTGFFLAQVYTEGLFLGLSFSSLALLRRKRWFWAALLASLATLTRAVGVALVIPLALAWFRTFGRRPLQIFWQEAIAKGLLVVAPLITHLIWKVSFLGEAFTLVERHFFKCELFAWGRVWSAWYGAFVSLFGNNSETVVYYGIEFAAIFLGVVACLLTWRQYPGISLYGLAVIAVSLTCGLVQGMPRYVLAAPSIFLVLSRWGDRIVFDRAWTIASVLLMGLMATLFTFDLWVG